MTDDPTAYIKAQLKAHVRRHRVPDEPKPPQVTAESRGGMALCISAGKGGHPPLLPALKPALKLAFKPALKENRPKGEVANKPSPRLPRIPLPADPAARDPIAPKSMPFEAMQAKREARRRDAIAAAAAAPADPSVPKSKCVQQIEAMQAKREARRRDATAAKELRMMDEDAANKAGVAIEAVDFLRLLADYRRAHHISAAVAWPCRDEHVWMADRGTSRIRVVVRKRPMLKVEATARDFDIVDVPTSADCRASDALIVHEPKTRVDLTKAVESHHFTFDGTFSELDSNESLFGASVRPLLGHVLSGGTATVFAYGQTGSGKTFMMTGHGDLAKADGNALGLYALAARELMAVTGANGFRAGLSFFEVYRGQVLDLLGERNRLDVQEDGKGRVNVVGLTEVPVEDASAMLALIEQAGAQRATGATSANDVSSRSHAILQVVLRRAGTGEAAGRLNLVDLAGSERACDSTSCDRQTRVEGADINKSLLALKECIRGLDTTDASHVPFRGSKLTHVLREAFVGDAKTCMVATVSPGAASTEHTLNTLRYAQRVKSYSAKAKPAKAAVPSRPVPHLLPSAALPMPKPPAKRGIGARSPPSSAPEDLLGSEHARARRPDRAGLGLGLPTRMSPAHAWPDSADDDHVSAAHAARASNLGVTKAW